MTFRLAAKRDADSLARMRWDFHREDGPDVNQSWPEFRETFSAFFLQAVDDGRWFFWIAESDSQPVSHIYVYVVPKVPRPDRSSSAAWGYVTNVYTVPSFRGRGIGGKLLATVHHWAVENSLELLLTWPDPRRVDFYKREGFQPSSEAMELTFDAS